MTQYNQTTRVVHKIKLWEYQTKTKTQLRHLTVWNVQKGTKRKKEKMNICENCIFLSKTDQTRKHVPASLSTVPLLGPASCLVGFRRTFLGPIMKSLVTKPHFGTFYLFFLIIFFPHGRHSACAGPDQSRPFLFLIRAPRITRPRPPPPEGRRFLPPDTHTEDVGDGEGSQLETGILRVVLGPRLCGPSAGQVGR